MKLLLCFTLAAYVSVRPKYECTIQLKPDMPEQEYSLEKGKCGNLLTRHLIIERPDARG